MNFNLKMEVCEMCKESFTINEIEHKGKQYFICFDCESILIEDLALCENDCKVCLNNPQDKQQNTKEFEQGCEELSKCLFGDW